MDMSNFAATRFPTLPLVTSTGAETALTLNQVEIEISKLPELLDETLLTQSATGDRDALALLFRRYAPLVRGVSLRILRDEGEAEDMVQELFLFIHCKAGVYDSAKSTARSWIVQMTYRRAISRWRYLNTRGHYRSEEMDCCAPKFASAAIAQYDSSLEALFGREGLKKVMEELTADQRETLRLHFYEGYTVAEISEKLGQSPGNVRNHYYRGLEKLRRQVRESKLQKR